MIASIALSPAIRASAASKQLVSFARNSRLDLVIVALPITAEKRVIEVTRSLAVLPADIKLPARATELRFTPGTYSHVGNVAMIDLLRQADRRLGHRSPSGCSTRSSPRWRSFCSPR